MGERGFGRLVWWPVVGTLVLLCAVTACRGDGAVQQTPENVRDVVEDQGEPPSDGGEDMGPEDVPTPEPDVSGEDVAVPPMDAAGDVGEPGEDVGDVSEPMSDADSGSDAGPESDVDDGPDAGDPCGDLQAAYRPPTQPADAPPFNGTVFITPDILTEDDPTSFTGLTYQGQGQRTMFDRRINRFDTFNPHLFDARFGQSTGLVVEIQINPEFSQQEAQTQATLYATAIGRLPGFLFASLQTVWIHAGDQLFGGGNNNLLIHTGQGQRYIRDGLLEEVFIHEGAHTSLDAQIANDPLWLAAVETDTMAISTYARDNPLREDVAETLGPFLAAALRPQSLTPTLLATIQNTIPNRSLYLQCQGLSLDPLP